MLSKKERPYQAAALPPGKRFKHNVQDLFASNMVSGARAQELLQDAEAAGAELPWSLTKGSKHTKNATRDLGRRLLKKSLWPPPYQAKVRTWGYKHHIAKAATVPIMRSLPEW